MQYRDNGVRYKDYCLWGDRKSAPYDYERYGILQHTMSSIIVNSKNPILKFVLNYYEKSIIFMLKYIDRLKNFKNYHWKNR